MTARADRHRDPRGRAPRVVVLGLSLATGLPACGETPAPVECTAGQIVGGTSEPQLGPLDAQLRATMASVVVGADAQTAGLCTGVAITGRAVLTARHCFDGSGNPAADATVILGGPVDSEAMRGRVQKLWFHPTLDAALLQVAWPDDRSDRPTPVPLFEGVLDDAWVGAQVELAGFGVSGEVEEGGLRFATEQIASVEPDHVVVDGHGQSGACVGDSGGPLFGRMSDGRLRVIGVLDDGDASCVGQDRYTRTDRLAGWDALVQAAGPAEDGCPR